MEVDSEILEEGKQVGDWYETFGKGLCNIE